MDERQRRHDRPVLQIGVVVTDLSRCQHSLEYDQEGGQTRDIEVLAPGHIALVANLPGGALADDVQLSFEGVLVVVRLFTTDENLANRGLHALRRLPQVHVVRRHPPPAQNRLPFLFHDSLDDFFLSVTLVPIGRQENHADPVISGPRQVDPDSLTRRLKEAMRNLHQDSGPVSCIGLAAPGSTMVQIHEHLERLADDPIGLLPLDVGNETDPARIVLVLRVVQTLFGGESDGVRHE